MEFWLILSMFTYIFYLTVLFVFGFLKRFKAVQSGKAKAKYFKSYSDKTMVPEDLIVFERHVDNQFQLPTIFLVTGVAHLAVLERVGLLSVILAWAFVLSRFIHSYIHLGKNVILHRASAYAFGLLVVLLMWLHLLYLVRF